MTMTPKEILDLAMRENDADAKTIREYLGKLLEELWSEGESFSGERPFGNSAWEYDLYNALVTGGAVAGEVDEDGDIISFDKDAADQAIFDVIDECFNGGSDD